MTGRRQSVIQVSTLKARTLDDTKHFSGEQPTHSHYSTKPKSKYYLKILQRKESNM